MVHRSFIFGSVDGYTVIIFVTHVKLALSKEVLFVLRNSIAGDFHNKATIEVIRNDKTWMETVLTCFTNMIAEQLSLTQFERSMWHMKGKIIVLSFSVISFVILIFVFQRFDIKSGFPFYWLTLYIKKIGRRSITSVAEAGRGGGGGEIIFVVPLLFFGVLS